MGKIDPQLLAIKKKLIWNFVSSGILYFLDFDELLKNSK